MQPQVTRLDQWYPYVFRARWHEGTFYSASGEVGQGNGPLELIASEDGVNWHRHAHIALLNGHGFSAESELHWRPDGELWCVIRTGGPAVLYSAEPPK